MPTAQATFTSPFTDRYGSPEMRALWSDDHRRGLWRWLWVALAEAQARAGVVTAEQAADLRSHAGRLNTARALEIEREIGHDVMAEVRAFAEQCLVGGGIIHWGATSADITDNADVLRQREALALLATRLRALLGALAEKIEAYAHVPGMAYTHLQPAEPTTLGYRLAGYGQDLLTALREVERQQAGLRGKGLKGAVGTAAAYQELLAGTGVGAAELEAWFLESAGLTAFPIATQTYPRSQDYSLLTSLAGTAATLHKFAFDVRVLQSQGLAELAEPFGDKQVGSSAMPFKRNPVNAEKICSLARLVAALPAAAWENAAEALLERTLDDSGNRRVTLPEAFLALEECVLTAERVVRGLVVNRAAIAANLEKFGPLLHIEIVPVDQARVHAPQEDAHVCIVGTWAWDKTHGIAEIHPAFAVETC